jgi:hypothetical protein
VKYSACARRAYLVVAWLFALLLVSASSPQAHGASAKGVSSAWTSAPARALTWAAPQHIDAATTLMASVSCATPRFCMAMDAIGNAFTWNGQRWSGPVKVDPSGGGFYFISCPTSTFCAEIGGSTFSPNGGGNARTWNGHTWSRPVAADAGGRVTGFSCASATLCVAVDTSGHAVTWNGRTWQHEVKEDLGVENPQGAGFLAVSCAGAGFCLAVSNDESYLIRQGQEGWSNPMPMAPLLPSCMARGPRGTCYFASGAVSCAGDRFCLLVANGGINAGPGAATAWNGQTWSAPQLSAHLNAVSCAGAHFCVTVDNSGHAFTWNGRGWSKGINADPHGPLNALESVSCPTAGFCMTVDNGGDVLVGRAA